MRFFSLILRKKVDKCVAIPYQFQLCAKMRHPIQDSVQFLLRFCIIFLGTQLYMYVIQQRQKKIDTSKLFFVPVGAPNLGS